MSAAIANPLINELPGMPWDNRANQRHSLVSETNADDCFKDIIGNSAGLQKVLEQVKIVANTDATVLLHGETGTGKELIAQAIHNLSSRRQRTLYA